MSMYLSENGGTGDEQFNTPHSVAIDYEDIVYVAEDSNAHIQKFDSNGNFITKWGSKGDGQFGGYLGGIAVDFR